MITFRCSSWKIVAVGYLFVFCSTFYASEHWAFKVPQRDKTETNKSDVIDLLIKTTLEKSDQTMRPLAPKSQLIRRLSYDLRGIPPSPSEVASFINDESVDAWKIVVDKFLESHHFGERMAQNWFDLARFADTSGYAADRTRNVWPYRDWVIKSINDNIPYDQFTVEQLAGDLLPGSTDDQKLATGFHRQAMQAKGNNPRKEEFRIKGIVDRINTTGRTWLGLTLECAECHDHKYDPISQKEYYELFAIFNNIPHLGTGFNTHGPKMKYLPDEDRSKVKDLQMKIKSLSPKSSNLIFPAESQHLLGKWKSSQRLQDPKLFSVTSDLTIFSKVKTTSSVADIVSKYDWKAGQRSFVFGIGGESQKNAVPGHLFAWISSSAEAWAGVEVHGSFPINDGKDHEVALVFDAGHSIQLVVDGIIDHAAKVIGKIPNSIAKSNRPLSIGSGYDNSLDKKAFSFEGTLSEVRIYNHAFILKEQKNLGVLQSRIEELQSRAIEVPVMQELGKPRETHVLLRGDFKQKGERVFPDVPKVFSKPELNRPMNRLDFAKWLVDKKNPLTSRVAVNYLWQHFFGSGIVSTSSDFGVQGEPPASLELLDWLALEFIESGWNRKHLVRLMVNSSAYKQESVSYSLAQRFFGLMPRIRLPAEQIRDHFLTVSGLMDFRIGGPSIFPIQPEGFYEERGQNTPGNSNFTWKVSSPDERYRKSMYIYWKRMALHPSLSAFDAPTRQVCVSKRSISNTPQQALVTLNDPMFDECSRALSKKLSSWSDTSPDIIIDKAFMLCLSRLPDEEEKKKFIELFKKDGWYSVATVLLNLDESLTRE